MRLRGKLVTDRPLAVFRDGQLWKDMGGVYCSVPRFHVLMTREMFSTRTDANAKRYAKECQDALNEQDKAMEVAT